MKRSIYITFLLSILWSQPVDLSLEWTTNDGLFFSEELEAVIEEEISDLYNILGIIVIYKGEVVSEHYYNNSFEDDVYNIWSVTKSYISALVGQAVDLGMMYDPDSLAYHFFPEYDIEYLEDIKLHNLLSMSSGYLDGFGSYPAWVFATSGSVQLRPSPESGAG